MSGAGLSAFRQKLSGMDRDEIIEEAVNLFKERSLLNIRLEETQHAVSEMVLQFHQMKDELKAVKHENSILLKQNRHLTGVSTMRTDELYGRSTERRLAIFLTGLPEAMRPTAILLMRMPKKALQILKLAGNVPPDTPDGVEESISSPGKENVIFPDFRHVMYSNMT